MLKGIYILDSHSYDLIYGPAERAEISGLVEMVPGYETKDSIRGDLGQLQDIDLIFSGWGAPVMDEQFLQAAPKLKAVFYGAGSIKYFVTEAFWEREITVTSAYAANAVPVAEYTLSQILFSLKRGWWFAAAVKERKRYPDKNEQRIPGGYGSTVGIVSLGMIGRLVCKLLQPFDLKIIAYDPFVEEKTAEELGVKLCSLEEVFREADVVSLHTPWLKETENMITAKHLRSMKPHATFINTARGAIVNESELIEVLKQREDLQAVLDVTYPEPPVAGSPLYTLPNVVLTPHIAGSLQGECRRMGRYMVEELKRFLAGQPLRWQIDKQQAAIMA